MWIATAVAVLLAALPALYAQIAAPKGSGYIGYQFNTDDHMVYAAWMRQAMDGRFLFDNRFTTDAQPGLTVHLYFWVLGSISKLTGIGFSSNLARLAFTGLFIPILYRLVRRLSGSVFVTRMAIVLTVLGGGVGFLVWDNFGRTIDPARPVLSSAMLGLLPVDVWQPEAFVFPSMLTNGLFMVSLCLIAFAFQCFLDAKEGWKPVLWGALAIALLMNIHSYDVLMIAFVMVGFVAMQLARRSLSAAWLGRGLMIAAGALPAALWFVHVLREDAVFQARAATPTYSANFRQVFFGYLLMFLLALPGLWSRLNERRQRIGVSLLSLLILVLFVFGTNSPDTYFLSAAGWAVCAVVSVSALVLMSSGEPALDLVLAWAAMGLIALYFPALFQRKLAMGLSIPWAILAALGFSQLVKLRERSARNLATVLTILVFSATSVFWFQRELYLIRNDISSTTTEPVFLSHDVREILRLLNADPAPRKILIAMPGIAAKEQAEDGTLIPDRFVDLLPDLNPIFSGLSGVYTYAGHWSETPDYESRRGKLTALFNSLVPSEGREAILSSVSPQYIVQPSPETFGPNLNSSRFQLADLSGYGEVVFSGSQFKLIRVRR